MSNLNLLTPEEQQSYDYPPALPVDIRALSFAINYDLETELKRLRTPTNKVGFLLQYGYIKACNRFFIINRFRQEDVEYTAKLLGIAIDEIDWLSYKKRMPIEHQKKILALLNYQSFDNTIYAWLKEEASLMVEQQTEPKQIFLHLLVLLQQNKIEIPSYHRLAELVTHAYQLFEQDLLLKIGNCLTAENKKLLDALLKSSKSPSMLNQLKTINQSTKPKAIQASLALFSIVKDYFLKLSPAINALKLSPQSSTYYATWVQKSKHSQLMQFPEEEKLYLHLVAFIQHQFYMRQDYFIDIILKCVQSVRTTAIKKLNELENLSRSERRQGS